MLIGIDLDDTLFDESSFAISAFTNVAKYAAAKSDYSAERLLNFILHKFYSVGRNRLLEDFLVEFPRIEVDLTTLVGIFRKTRPVLNLFPDSLDFLTIIRDSDFDLVLITDGISKVQRAKIDCLGIKNFFSKIYITSDFPIEYRKPSKSIFELAMSDFNVAPSHFVYIGDNPFKDFAGPSELGAKTIRILRGTFEDSIAQGMNEPNLVIKGFEQLTEEKIYALFRH